MTAADPGHRPRSASPRGPAPFQREGRPGWYVKVRHPQRGWITLKAGDTLERAWAFKTHTEDEYDLIRRGVITRRQLSAADQRQRPLAELLEQWRDHMAGHGRTPKHVARYHRMAWRVLMQAPPVAPAQDAKGVRRRVEVKPGPRAATTWLEIDPNTVDIYLADLVRVHGHSAKSRNEHLAAAQAFCRWAVRHLGIDGASPLACLTRLNHRRDPRLVYRALTVEQFDRFIEAVRTMPAAPTRRRGPQRRHSPAWYVAAYLVAGRCGARWTELAKLRWQHIDADGGAIDFGAEITKTGESGRVPMTEAVAEALATIRPATATARDLIFGERPKTATMRRHLDLAEIPWTDDAGRIVSLRKTLASNLIAAGVTPRTLQMIMRHADIRTTMRHYSDPNLVDTRGALERLRHGHHAAPGIPVFQEPEKRSSVSCA